MKRKLSVETMTALDKIGFDHKDKLAVMAHDQVEVIQALSNAYYGSVEKYYIVKELAEYASFLLARDCQKKGINTRITC